MSKDVFVRRLRPHLFSAFKRSQCPHPTRAFSSHPCLRADDGQHDVTRDYQKRVAQLQAHKPLAECYPRLSQSAAESGRQGLDIKRFESLQPGETAEEELTLTGRVHSVRSAGSKLSFVDIQTANGTVQAVCQLDKLQQRDGSFTMAQFKTFSKVAREHDVYSIVGHPHRTARGELSVLASELPTLLSPSLHQVPEALEDPEARARARHVDMLVNPEAVRTLLVRHEVERALQHFFDDQGFTKVTTPILSASAGGAAARPFETEATEFAGENLSLRIAPELWLKRLIVGGMQRVYEMGPAFRNEGVDATHNPEFNICEFYMAYATLRDLINQTKSLLSAIELKINEAREVSGTRLSELPPCNVFQNGFDEVEFIPALEQKLDGKLPDLNAPDALDRVHRLYQWKGLTRPPNPTLPRLLDHLAAQFLEPLSNTKPTFITNHPACMSPLSKHFVCEKTGQTVAARAELFIGGREYANMYEEENSPFEQRRKFEEQMKQREKDAEAMELDESYLQALEWGMPPTGGWGCGVDRLVMLFSGRERMADVLAFGSLRNVVGLGSGKRR